LEAHVTGLLEALSSELAQIQQADPADRDAALAALRQKIATLQQSSNVPAVPPVEIAPSNPSDDESSKSA
jgi:hypothetical protein